MRLCMTVSPYKQTNKRGRIQILFNCMSMGSQFCDRWTHQTGAVLIDRLQTHPLLVLPQTLLRLSTAPPPLLATPSISGQSPWKETCCCVRAWLLHVRKAMDGATCPRISPSSASPSAKRTAFGAFLRMALPGSGLKCRLPCLTVRYFVGANLLS